MQAIACHRANLVAMGCTSQLFVSHQRQAECQVYGGRVFKIVGVKFVKSVVKFVKSAGVKLWVSNLCIDVKTRRCGSRNEESEDLVAGRFRRGFHRGPRRCGTERTISSTSACCSSMIRSYLVPLTARQRSLVEPRCCHILHPKLPVTFSNPVARRSYNFSMNNQASAQAVKSQLSAADQPLVWVDCE